MNWIVDKLNTIKFGGKLCSPIRRASSNCKNFLKHKVINNAKTKTAPIYILHYIVT